MARLFTRASVTGATLTGAALKAVLTALFDALNSKGVSDAARTTIIASGTLATTQCGLVKVDCTSGSVALTLPTSGTATDDAEFKFRRIDNTPANSLTILRGGTDTIEGLTTALLVPPLAQTDLQLPSGDTTWRVTGVSGGTARGARNNQSASDSPFRNVIINGNCSEDLRNSGAAQTIVAGAALAYCIDRFFAFGTGANVTGQQITATDGTKRYRYTGGASVATVGHGHRVSADNSVHLAGGVATFSAKLSNSLLTTVSWAAYYATTTDAFGTVAVPTRTLIASGSFTVNATEATYSAQINVPAAATTGIEVVLSVGAQVSGTWTIGEVQLEAGAIPAPAISFERIEKSENRRRCMNYKQRLGGVNNFDILMQGYGAAASNVGFTLTLPVPMRASPTGTKVGTWGVNNASQPAVVATSPTTVTVNTTATALGFCQFNTTGSTTYVDLDAEL